MSAIWPKYSAENPCPICHHGGDWTCRAGDKKTLCMRVESGHPAADGGWYHDFTPNNPRPVSHFKMPSRPKVFNGQIRYVNGELKNLAIQLGVKVEALEKLGAGKYGDVWAFPMFDGEGKQISISRRMLDGSKKHLGSPGLFLPNMEPQDEVYIPEGASDCAAFVSMGFFAIGRPSCNYGGEMIRQTIRRLKCSRAVIIADNDDIKDFGSRPGYQGALKLKKEIGVPSVIWASPSPCKDVRDLIKKIGMESTQKLILSDISHKIWTR